MADEVFRKEIKYVISQVEFIQIRNKLNAFLEPDRQMDGRGYRVKSLYFDTMEDLAFHQSWSGVKDRCKIRLRWYPDAPGVFKLEHKCKSLTDSRKQVLLLSEHEARQMAFEDCGFLLERPEPLARKLYATMKLGACRRRTVVEYVREAYWHHADNTRITFDTAVTATEVADDFFDSLPAGTPIMEPGKGVLELKFNGSLLPHFERIVSRLDVQASSNSKYVQSRLGR